jgi:hypothetical protein
MTRTISFAYSHTTEPGVTCVALLLHGVRSSETFAYAESPKRGAR